MMNNNSEIEKIFEETAQYPKGVDVNFFLGDKKVMNEDIYRFEKEINRKVSKTKLKRFFRLFKNKDLYNLKIKELEELVENFKKTRYAEFIDKQEEKLTLWKEAFRERCLTEIGEISTPFKDILADYIELKSIDLLKLTYLFYEYYELLFKTKMVIYKLSTIDDMNPFKYVCMSEEEIKKSQEEELAESMSPIEENSKKRIGAEMKKVIERYIEFAEDKTFFIEQAKQEARNLAKEYNLTF